MPDKVKASDLEDGSILVSLKMNFLASPSQETLFPLLCCLRDSVVSVPFVAEMSEEDKRRYRECKEGENFENKDEVRLSADILKAANDAMFFPIFSQPSQMPEDYSSKFTVIPIKVEDAVRMAHGDSSVSGLVLDGFNDAFVLPFDLADYMMQIPSRLEEDEK